MADETTQIPVRKATRQKLRNISTKGETYDKLINKLITIRKKFEDEDIVRRWFENNFETLGFTEIKENENSISSDYIGIKNGTKKRIKIEPLSSNFIKKGHDFKEVDLIICILAEEKLPIETIEITDILFKNGIPSIKRKDYEYKETLLLSELLQMNANRKPCKINLAELAEKIEINEEAVSNLLAELSKKDLIEFPEGKEKQILKITEKGIEHLKSLRDRITESLEKSLKELEMVGTLVCGFGEGSYYVKQEKYRKQFREKLGFDPYPGTLDLKLNKESLLIKEKLEKLQGEKIEGFKSEERSFGEVECFPAKINSEKAAIVLPSRTHHEKDVIEIISPVKIRDKYNLEEGDEIKVEVKI